MNLASPLFLCWLLHHPRAYDGPEAVSHAGEPEFDLDERIAARLRELGLLPRGAASVAAAPPEPKSPARSLASPFEPRRQPFTFADFSWLPGNYGPDETPLKWKAFTGEIRLDTVYHYAFSNPRDNTIAGSSEVFRSNELQLTQIGFGGNVFYENVHARLMTQFGMYSQTTPRNDASYERGQWRMQDAYRYISEAYAGYHIPVWHGINVQAGIFMSYVGLWSYYNFDNWTYQPSYVSSNTPWFFNGVRVQIFPTKKLKIEPWIVNGWQSYGKLNDKPGFGLQVQWRPHPRVALLGNQYYGTDTLGIPGRRRIHTDDSLMLSYRDRPESTFTRGAVSLTIDAGCETGGGVSCSSQYFVGFMAYHRMWLWNNRIGLTVGGGGIVNPGRYLVLLPPVNGATAFSGTPYFTAQPGDRFAAWDTQATADFMPNRHLTFRLEYNHRQASVPYFAGRGGVTPPGGNAGAPGSFVEGWSPDLVRIEDRVTLAMMVRY